MTKFGMKRKTFSKKKMKKTLKEILTIYMVNILKKMLQKVEVKKYDISLCKM